VLQGERAMAKDNKSLGKFQLAGIPPAPRGVPQIEVAFEIDANGILKVAARDKGTGRAQSIEISNTGGLSRVEIERMRQESELYAMEDAQRKQVVELKNRADSLFYTYETTMRDNSDIISAAIRQDAADKHAVLKAVVANSNATLAEVSSALENLQAILFNIGSAVYDQNGSTASHFADSTAAAPTKLPDNFDDDAPIAANITAPGPSDVASEPAAALMDDSDDPFSVSTPTRSTNSGHNMASDPFEDLGEGDPFDPDATLTADYETVD
jgi:molecular chaperone DnaK